MLGNFSCFYCRLLTFQKLTFFLEFFQEHYQTVWSHDQDRHSVGPDLGPSCLQRLTADEELDNASRQRVNKKLPGSFTLLQLQRRVQ